MEKLKIKRFIKRLNFKLIAYCTKYGVKKFNLPICTKFAIVLLLLFPQSSSHSVHIHLFPPFLFLFIFIILLFFFAFHWSALNACLIIKCRYIIFHRSAKTQKSGRCKTWLHLFFHRKKCQSCAKAKPDCTSSPTPQSNVSKVIQTSKEPPDLFTHKDQPSTKMELSMWYRTQATRRLLFHQSTSNPTLHERLDRELGDKLPNYGSSLSSNLIKSWFGVDKGLMKVLNDFVAKSRKPDQDLHH